MDKKELFQKYFDQAAKAVIAQGKRSVVWDGGASTCVYRHPDGLKCAIGHLISDDDIEKFCIKEGQTPSAFPEAFFDKFFTGVPGEEASYFLEQLQDAHDYSSGPNFAGVFTSRMNTLAEMFGLRGL